MNVANRSLKPMVDFHLQSGIKHVVRSNLQDMEQAKMHDVASINREIVYEFEVMESMLQHRILREMYNAQRILDVGCGDGDLVSYLARSPKKEVTGLDISDSGFDKALAKAARYGISNLVRCVKGDAQHPSRYFKNEEFDAVTMIYTLHHLHQPVRALQELGRILKPDGRILIVAC
ncbi:MAG: class I SAM-dependent methyltransferase, partial [Candidatus Thorarchaeota archaeon]